MAIRTVPDRGFGPGGSIAKVALRGFAIGALPPTSVTIATRGYGGNPRNRISTLVRRGFASYKKLPEPPLLGKQYKTCSSTSWSGDSLQENTTPPVALGDIFVTDTKTSLQYPISINGDGTEVIDARFDNTRELHLADIFDVSLDAYYGQFKVYLNNRKPVTNLALIDQRLLLGSPFAAINFIPSDPNQPVYVFDPEGDPLTSALQSGSLPTGMTFAAGTLSGTPTAAIESDLVFRFTDILGEYTDLGFHLSVDPGATVPTLKGLSQAAALAAIIAAGFGRPPNVTFAYDVDTVVGNVSTQDPPPSSFVFSDSLISIVVSQAAQIPTLGDVITPATRYFFGSGTQVIHGGLVFVNADLWSIAPAIESWMTFDVLTGDLTLDMNSAPRTNGVYGPYTITGYNDQGQADANPFSINAVNMATSNILFLARAATVIAPTMSGPTPAGTLGTQTTATTGGTTNQTSGTLYAIADTAANLVGITAAQIKAGQNKNSAAALASGNAAISTTTPSVSLTGFTAGGTYSYALVQHNANGDSNVISGTFTNVAALAISSPTPSGTLGSQTTATVGLTTNQASGTLYVIADSAANLVGITAAQIKAGNNKNSTAAVAAGSSTISSTTPSVGLTGLTAGTAYSYASVQNNVNGDSNVSTGTFTTSAADSFTNDPYSSYGDPRIVDPTVASDVAGGTAKSQTWNGVTKSYQCYKTVQYAMGDWFSSSGGRRVGLLASTTYTLAADLYAPFSGASDSARNILQGDPAAIAANIPVIDCNTIYGIKPDKNNACSNLTFRKFALTGQNKTPSDGNANPSPIYLGSGTHVYSGFVAEFLNVHDCYADSSGYDFGGIVVSAADQTIPPIIRYCKFKNIGQFSQIPTFSAQNFAGVYVGSTAGAQILNCEMDNTSDGGYHKFSSSGHSTGSPNGSIWRRNIFKNCYNGLVFANAGASGFNGFFGCEVTNNLFQDTNQNAVLAFQVDSGVQCDGFLLKNNTIAGASWGLGIGGWANITALNNAIIAATLTLYTQDSGGNTTSFAQCDYTGVGGTVKWTTHVRGTVVNYTGLAAWQANASDQVSTNPDTHAVAITTGAFTNYAGKDFSPASSSSPLYLAGSDGKNLGCYDALTVAGSTLIGAGW